MLLLLEMNRLQKVKRMKSFHHEGMGDKWSMLVLITLKANGTMRFSDIARSIGDVSQRMLTVTLRHLETDGLVERCVFPEVPPRVEYTLTQMGQSLMPHLENLVAWAEEHEEVILSRRAGYKDEESWH